MNEPRQLDAALIRGMSLVALFAAVAGAARVAQDAVIAWRFGMAPVVDAYYFVISLANWPVAVALSMLTWMVAPADALLRGRDAASAQNFRAELLGAAMFAAAVALPLTWWLMRTIAGGALGGLDATSAAEATAGVPGLAAMVPLGIVGALLSAWFVAAGRHVLTLLEALPPLVLIAVIIAVPGPVLFWGTSAGVAVQVLAMGLVLRHAGELPAPRLGFSASAWHGFSQGAIAMLAGQILFALVPLVDAFFAARLGEGAMAAFSYTNRLVLGLQGLTGLMLQRVGLPLLSRLSAQSLSLSINAAVRWAIMAAVAGVVVGIVVALLADPLVSLVYERGSFTAADREQVSTLIRYGMLQMPLFLGGMALVTALASVRANRGFALAAAAGLGVKLLLSVVLVPLIGLAGLLLATAVMYGGTAAIAWAVMRRHVRTARP